MSESENERLAYKLTRAIPRLRKCKIAACISMFLLGSAFLPSRAYSESSGCEVDPFSDAILCNGSIISNEQLEVDQQQNECLKAPPLGVSEVCYISGNVEHNLLQWSVSRTGQPSIFIYVPARKTEATSETWLAEQEAGELKGYKRSMLSLKVRVGRSAPQVLKCDENNGQCNLFEVAFGIDCSGTKSGDTKIVVQAKEEYRKFLSPTKFIDRSVLTYDLQKLNAQICAAQKTVLMATGDKRN